MTQTKKVMVPDGFTADELTLVRSAARAAWDYIGADCLRGMEEAGEKPVMKRADVIEVVIDAGRLVDQLRRLKASDELIARWKALEYDVKIKLLVAAFPYARYGW